MISKNLKYSDLSQDLQISQRTIRDWYKEKFTIPYNSLIKLSNKYNFPIPQDITLVSDYWYGLKGASKGGKMRAKLYGSPGTPEGRKKGGLASQANRHNSPEKYLNCKLSKEFSIPRKSVNLAELIGIILGDGGLTASQLKITLNKELEIEYIEFAAQLIEKIFKEKPKKYYFSPQTNKTCNLCLSGINLIKSLNSLGLNIGSKVKNQSKVPEWINQNLKYSLACLRGLNDTDGCIYIHKHKDHGVSLINLGFSFSNHSQPLLIFVYQTLLKLGYHPKLKPDSVWLYRESEVIKYMRGVNPHNLHHWQRFDQYFTLKPGRGV